MRMQNTGSSETEPTGNKKIWRVGIYVRLSRDDGKEESLSIENQQKIILDFLKESFAEHYIIAGIYADDGQTGTDYDRPAFLRMLQDAERGNVNCIICKNLSRAFRNYSDQGYFLEKYFPKLGIRFVTLGDPKVDTFLHPEALSGMEIPMSGLLNDRYACRTSADIRRTFDIKRRKGEFIGAFPPYGYLKDPDNKNHLIRDPDASEIVQMIFKWYVFGDGTDGYYNNKEEKLNGCISKQGIARKLNAMGIPNPAAYKTGIGMKYRNPQSEKNDGLWNSSTVASILSNEMYTGTMVQGRQRVKSYKIHERKAVPEEEWYKVPGTHEAIIDRKIFELAQKIQTSDIRRAPGKKQNYLFSGLLFCADCGKSMTRRNAKGIVYYNCSTYKRKSRTKCTIHSVRLDMLEGAVLRAVQEQISCLKFPGRISEEIQKSPVYGDSCRSEKKILEACAAEMEKIENIRAEVYLDWKTGKIGSDQYEKIKAKMADRLGKLEDRIKILREECASDMEKQNESPYLEEFVRNGNVNALSQGLLNSLVEKIEVQEGKKITICFRFCRPSL